MTCRSSKRRKIYPEESWKYTNPKHGTVLFLITIWTPNGTDEEPVPHVPTERTGETAELRNIYSVTDGKVPRGVMEKMKGEIILTSSNAAEMAWGPTSV